MLYIISIARNVRPVRCVSRGICIYNSLVAVAVMMSYLEPPLKIVTDYNDGILLASNGPLLFDVLTFI